MMDTIPTIAHLTDRAGALLDELDSLISDLDAAIGDQYAARAVLADAELEMSVIEASITLDTTGPNETARKAAVTLALRQDPGYAELARTAREARTALHDADRRYQVIKARCGLVRAALALLTAPAPAGAGGADA
jgi:hypothetical protein